MLVSYNMNKEEFLEKVNQQKENIIEIMDRNENELPITFSIQIPIGMAKDIKRITTSTGISRSEFIRQACKVLLKQINEHKKKQFDDYNE